MIEFPIYRPFIGEREKELVMDCMESTWISSRGKFVDLFESRLSEISGAKHAISMHNGTHPLHVACILSGVGHGDEVIIPSFSYVATGNAVAYCGAKAVFVDVDPRTWNIDPKKLEAKINRNTKAIIAVDIYGYPADYEKIKRICKKHKVKLIADSAESIGANYHGYNSGSFGELSTFSFFGNKTITTGEGGALLTNSDSFADRARQLKNQGNSNTQKYFHDVLGYNYRMTNIQAAIGVAQLERLEEILEKKRQIFLQYYEILAEYVSFQPLVKEIRSSYWLVSFCLPSHVDRDKLEHYLMNKGIETRPFFSPMDELPYFEKGHYPVARDISRRGICLPSYPQLHSSDIEYISFTIIEFLNRIK